MKEKTVVVLHCLYQCDVTVHTGLVAIDPGVCKELKLVTGSSTSKCLVLQREGYWSTYTKILQKTVHA